SPVAMSTGLRHALCFGQDTVRYPGSVRSGFLIIRAVLWLLFAISAASAAESNTVVVLRGSELEWEEASRVLEAELQATGFAVVRRGTEASTPGQLIDELRAAGGSETGVRGAVAVFRGVPAPRAYVWLPERDD